MKTFMFGAGASRGYTQNRHGIAPPLARDFFNTFYQLPSAADRNVLVGYIVDFVRETRGVSPAEFGEWSEDIEAFLSEVHAKIATTADLKALDFREKLLYSTTYTQMLFLFAHVLNEVQNGPAYHALATLCGGLGNQDALLTFNWDTLLDHALWQTGNWHPSDGYGVTFRGIFDNGWTLPTYNVKSNCRLIKLHGSTNWLQPYQGVLLEKNEWGFANDAIPAEERPLYCFLRAEQPYETFKDRYSGPYQPFAYCYYPPNVPIPPIKAREGYVLLRASLDASPTDLEVVQEIDPPTTESIPVLIAPVRDKEYDLMGGLIEGLWERAEESIRSCDELLIIGYSFPPTDLKALRLLDDATRRREAQLKITVVNPFPADIEPRLTSMLGGRASIKVESVTLEEFLGVSH